mgnify:CR=1 FL=1
MKEFSNWNQIKINTDSHTSFLNLREGEVRWCRVGINIGDEVLGKGKSFVRPVLVLKKFSKNVFLGAPLTSKVRLGDWYFPLESKGFRSSVILNQARLFDKKRLEEKLFEVSEKELEKIKHAYCSLILS